MKSIVLKQFVAASLLAAASGMAVAAGPPYSALYVFGDSLSDGGNNFVSFGGLNGPAPTSGTFIPSLPYASAAVYDTYSNGNVWVNSFASGLGLSSYAAPSRLGGGNYAYGGARMSVDGSAPPPLPPQFPASLQTQVNTYLSAGAPVTSASLYVIAGGGNDVRAAATAIQGGADPTATTVAGAQAFATSALTMVNQLKAFGAQNIIVWNIPDVGKAPAFGSGVGAGAALGSFIAGTFNSALNTALTGSGVRVFDTFGLIGSIVASPGTYGFGNVTQACGFSGNGCDASNALFWDGIHPTAFAQGVIANQMLAVAVPEVGTVAMFIAGLAGVGALVRRRRETATA